MSTISAGTTTTTTLVATGDTTGSLVFKTNDTGSGGTTAMTIDTSQNVGIGTSSPVAGARVTVVGGGTQLSGGTSSQEGVRFQRISGAATITGINNDNNAYNDIAMYAGASEGARLTTGNNFQFNSGYGSVATAYGCRAWVNFNGTGTVAIRASGNVSSITDNGAGDYTVNFTNAMPDANYTTFCSNRENYTSGTSDTWGFLYEGQPTTSATRVQTGQTAGKFDSVEVNVVIFR